ncbi:MAG: hypothetical protein ACE5EK_01675, partial [Nitrospinales bacterium]
MRQQDKAAAVDSIGEAIRTKWSKVWFAASRLGTSDRWHDPLGLGLHALGQVVQNIGRCMDPAGCA